MWKRNAGVPLLLVAMIGINTACSDKAADPQPTAPEKAVTQTKEPEKPLDPVTLKVWLLQPLTDEEFDSFVVKPVKAKYPHISLEIIRTTGSNFEQLVAANLSTDLIYMHDGALSLFTDLGVTFNIEDLVKTNGIDLGAFGTEYLDAIRSYSTKKELRALPHSVKYPALFYNKSIFDQFGAPYPTDGMTWDDAIELTKRVARDGYHGLDVGPWGRILRQMGLAQIVDPATMKASINTPEMRYVFDLTRRIYTVPGNEPVDIKAYPGANDFVKGTLAMFGVQTNYFPTLYGQSVSWDVAQFPNIPSRGNIGYDTDIDILTPFATSKHRDDVMRVMKVMTSPEVQRLTTERTRMTVLKDKSITADFGKAIPDLKGKRVSSIFKTTLVPPPPRTKHYSTTANMLRDAFLKYYETNDANTAIREAEEQINKYVQDNK